MSPRIVSLVLLLLGCVSASAADLDIDKLMRESSVVDSEGTYFQRRDGGDRESDPFVDATGKNDFGKLKEYCGRNLTVMNVSGERSLAGQVERIKNGTYKNAVLVQRFGDIAALPASRKFGVIFYIQTWEPLGGSVKKLADWQRQGLRILNLAYGRGHNPAPEDVLGRGTGEEGGLTPMGQKVIAEMNRLQMVVDVSHANDQTTIEACRVSKAPVIATHANCRAVTPVDRNKSDEALQAIAKSGGVIGVASIGWMIADPSGKKDVAAFIKHIDHLKSVVGIDHIGLASDGFLNGWAPTSNHYACPELAAPERWRTVAKALAEKGYTAEEIQKILGLNWVRVFKGVLAP